MLNIDPSDFKYLNDRLYKIFEGVVNLDPKAFKDYHDLVLLETAFIVFESRFEDQRKDDPQEEEKACIDLAIKYLNAILTLLTPTKMESIKATGAFVWWRKKLRALIFPYYSDDGTP